MRNFLFGFLCCALLCAICVSVTTVTASQSFNLMVNGKIIQCDVPPQMLNDRIMVPARFVAEALGATVEWDSGSKTVIINSIKESPTYSSQNFPTEEEVRQEQIEKIKYFYLKIQDVTDSTLEILDNEDVDSFSSQITVLSDLENELILWGTLDEYKEIKRLYIKHINGIGQALIYLRSGLSGINPDANYLIAQQYILGYQSTLREVTAELTSLKLKGLLPK